MTSSSIDVITLNALVFFLQWRKHWFVLTDQILRFYRDSVAEEVPGCLSVCHIFVNLQGSKVTHITKNIVNFMRMDGEMQDSPHSGNPVLLASVYNVTCNPLPRITFSKKITVPPSEWVWVRNTQHQVLDTTRLRADVVAFQSFL